MRKLAKNTVYVVEILKAYDGFNMYGKICNAYKITNAKREYLPITDEREEFFTSEGQMAREYMRKLGFELDSYLSNHPNLLFFSTEVKYKALK